MREHAIGFTAPWDILSLWGGIVVSLILTGVIWWAGQRLSTVPHLPGTGPSWTY